MEKGFVLVDSKYKIVIGSFHVTRKDVEKWALVYFTSPNRTPTWKDVYKYGWRIKPAILHITM